VRLGECGYVDRGGWDTKDRKKQSFKSACQYSASSVYCSSRGVRDRELRGGGDYKNDGTSLDAELTFAQILDGKPGITPLRLWDSLVASSTQS
jgi:hypothetical protein